MENQEEKETSIEYFWDKVWKNTELYENEYIALRNALNEAKKMYAEEIKKSFEKGYEKGVYTDGLIKDEKLPF